MKINFVCMTYLNMIFMCIFVSSRNAEIKVKINFVCVYTDIINEIHDQDRKQIFVRTYHWMHKMIIMKVQ